MTIPAIPQFSEVVESLTLTQSGPHDGSEPIQVVPRKVLMAGATPIDVPPILAWRKTTSLTSDALLDRIAKEVGHHQHPSSLEIAQVVLGMLCLVRPAMVPSVDALNQLLAAITSGSSSQFLISPFPPHRETRPFDVGRFTLGPLNRQRLEYRCRKVQCDYFDRYPTAFNSRFAIEGSPVPVRLIDWPVVGEHLRISPTATGTAITDHYFELLSNDVQTRFHAAFMQAQEVLVAAGAPVIEVDTWSWTGGSFVCIFQDVGRSKWGYFCPMSLGLAVDLAQADRRFPAKAAELRDTYLFNGVGNCELHEALGTFCRFVMRARIHDNHKRIDEAFLHYVIALDLLLGDKNASNDRISKRAAVIASCGVGSAFSEAVELVKHVYDRRSRYVHRGEPIAADSVARVVPVIDQVLQCLLRLQGRPEARETGAVVKWLKTLDFLAAAIEAGKQPGHEELAEAAVLVAPLNDGPSHV